MPRLLANLIFRYVDNTLLTIYLNVSSTYIVCENIKIADYFVRIIGFFDLYTEINYILRDIGSNNSRYFFDAQVV